ncbi:hypothetical protein [Paenibacillus dendritiformis]|uniref:hypothetical protein n=1 Tax=Paenibacillus dendritiformis TaxID=130049 RepID=UPI000DA700A9|nr:hypothetical protein [Paenibacillus dendritiformis]PZM61888.1 hypothetical protein DOE73_30210 [Paenibacillus dendritiformis]
MKKKFAAILSCFVLLFCIGTSSISASEKSWDLEGQKGNWFTVRSQGKITLNIPSNTVRFQGWASSIFAGGWGGNVEMKIWAKTQVTRYNGYTEAKDAYENQRTQNGSEQILVSVEVDDRYSAVLLSSATINAAGWISFDDVYAHVTASGDHGLE